MKGYIGTYASTQENGIYQFTFNEQKKIFEDVSILYHDMDAKYLSYYKGTLAYPCSQDKNVVKMVWENRTCTAGDEKHICCFIIQDDAYIYTANFHDGTLVRYKKDGSDISTYDTIHIKDKAGAHQVLLLDTKILVPCLFLDCIMVYDRRTLDYITNITFPKGSGPRHGVLNTENNVLYMLSELTCEVFCVYLDEEYRVEKKLSLLQDGEQGEGAAIRLSKDTRFLYISIRTCDKVYVIDTHSWTLIQSVNCGGKHPRDMDLDPSQQFVFVANRYTNNLVVFERDVHSGRIHPLCEYGNIIEGVSIVFEDDQYI